jgi:aarF domain-containing kinase
VRNQTDRITETAKAASFLASRLNENAPTWESEAGAADSIPSKETTEGQLSTNARTEIGQSHFYEASARNPAVGGRSEDVLEVQQEKAIRFPLSDGTIPSEESALNIPDLDQEILATWPNRLKEAARTMQRQSEVQIPSKIADASGDVPIDLLAAGHGEDSFYKKSLQSSLKLSSLPRVTVPRHTSAVQGDFHPSEQQIHSDSFYNRTITEAKTETISSLKASPNQEQTPDGVRTDLFHSSRVARSLGRRTQRATEEDLGLKGAKHTFPDHARLSFDKDSFQDRRSLDQHTTSLDKANFTYKTPLQGSASLKEDAKGLAQDILEERHPTEKTV